MKTIGLLTIAATLLSNATNTSSVGGPLTAMFILGLAIWAVGLQQAWSKEVGVLGWIACMVLSTIGGAAGIAISSVMMDTVLDVLHFQGSLSKSNHPLLYIMSTVMVLLTLIGSWSAIQILNLIVGRHAKADGDA